MGKVKYEAELQVIAVEMTVGVAAGKVGVSAKAVRLWEAKGLLPPAE